MSEKTKSRKKKKRNPIVAYFIPFGLRQACDIAMLAGAIVMFIGIFVSVAENGNAVAIIGMAIFAAACLGAMYRCLTVIFQKGINKRDPEYKTALVNLVIMGVLLALAIFGIIAAVVWS
ncbi:MAG: hypothetical protein FWD58_11405 [Firmicutes bacterium]|nr:hypothetical protein [Bacillota bacterium]